MKKQVMGNFKMNGSREMIGAYGRELTEIVEQKGPWAHDLTLFPAMPHFSFLQEALKALPVKFGAQDVSKAEGFGAMTGEVSAQMLKELGATHSLVGHSERRHKMGESLATVAAKLQSLMGVGIIPVLCIGETQAQYEAGQTVDVLKEQLRDLPQGPIVIAYEPVWAIGTGLTASLEIIDSVIQAIKRDMAPGLPVLYGGSVTPENAEDILGLAVVDGLLVGGASLKPIQMDAIARA